MGGNILQPGGGKLKKEGGGRVDTWRGTPNKHKGDDGTASRKQGAVLVVKLISRTNRRAKIKKLG